ncbi:MAG: hypothetical protein AB1529_04335 [Candidatus Micrarchaeota archaeon]
MEPLGTRGSGLFVTGTMAGRMGISYDTAQLARSIASAWGIPFFDRLEGTRAVPARAPETPPSLKERLRRSGDVGERTGIANELAAVLGKGDESDIRLMAAVYCNHKYLSAGLLQLLDDEPASLAFVARNAVLESAREDAIERLGKRVETLAEPSILTLVAQSHKGQKERHAAATKLSGMLNRLGNDPAALKAVYFHCTDQDKREIAIEKLAVISDTIRDPAAWKLVACLSRNGEARKFCVTKLRGLVGALAGVAMCGEYGDARNMALHELRQDAQLVADIACSCPFPDTRVLAVRLIGRDHKELARVASSSSYKDAEEAALQALGAMADRLDDVAALTSLLMRSNDEALVHKATNRLATMLERVTNKFVFIHVAMGADSGMHRMQALERLKSDAESLRVVMSHSPYGDSATAAKRMLAKLERRLSP